MQTNKIPGLVYYLKFQSAMIERLVWPDSPGKNELVRWRALILFSILFWGLVLGTLAFTGSIVAILEKGFWGLAVADVLCLGLGFVLLGAPGIKFEIRAFITCFIFYLIGIAVILLVGPQIGGPAWLFAFSVLAGVLLGSFAAFGAILMNAVFLLTICLLILKGKYESSLPFFNDPLELVAGVGNFLVVNAITAVSVSALVKGLFQTYKEKEALAENLKKEQVELVLIKQALELEIKDRKYKEIELKENERRFRELAESLPETIFEVDLKGRVTFVNKRGFEQFGYTKDDFEKGINVLERICESDRDRALKNIERIFQGEDIGINEYEVLKKDNTSFPALFHSSVIFHHDNAIGLRGFLIDITEKRRTQNHLIQAEKMMSIGGLAAGTAHELNNPLAGMIQNAQLIHSRLTKEIAANKNAAQGLGTSMSAITKFMEKRGVLKQLDSINQAGSRAAKIIDNMLSFAQKKGSIKNEHKIEEIIDKTIEIAQSDYDLKRKYDFRQIELIREYNSNIPAILCEASKIQQVFFNILKNASEAMSQNRHLGSAPKIIFRLKKQLNMVCVEIEDNGPGMDDEIRKRVFEPFYTTKDVDKGTGLGLSVSYFIIVDDHSGEMEVESVLGKGTKFIIKLPVD